MKSYKKVHGSIIQIQIHKILYSTRSITNKKI